MDYIWFDRPLSLAGEVYMRTPQRDLRRSPSPLIRTS